MPKAAIVPSLETARDVLAGSRDSPFPPNVLPLSATIPADLLTPTVAYLRIAEK
jgi:anthranilate synthase component I